MGTDLPQASCFIPFLFNPEKRGLLEEPTPSPSIFSRLLQLCKNGAFLLPGVRPWARALKEKWQKDPLGIAIYQKLFERGKLSLPQIDAEDLSGSAGVVIFPACHPLYAGEDTPLADLLFLLHFAKAWNAQRILEIGTYRARTTLGFHLNCPAATVVSYDIVTRPSPFREIANSRPAIQFRLKPFSEASAELLREPKFDLIFIDGSHKKEDVLSDSRLAFQIVKKGGAIIWHDYRIRNYRTDTLEVPEALRELAPARPIFQVRGTTCAIYRGI
jgi:hypothetical protein